MRKIAAITFCLMICTACSVSRTKKSHRSSKDSGVAGDSLSYYILNQNITSQGFYIERAEFNLKNSSIDRSGIGTIKFQPPDRYLVSLKLNSGIEILRIYIKGDSVQINDRINKVYLYGTSQMLKAKYGISVSALPVIFGDYINDIEIKKYRLNCANGRCDIDGRIGDLELSYMMDCRYGKSIASEPVEIYGNRGIQMSYGEFIKVNGKYAPGKISILEKMSDTKIEIKIVKITSPWVGALDFIPGKQYNKIPLL